MIALKSFGGRPGSAPQAQKTVRTRASVLECGGYDAAFQHREAGSFAKVRIIRVKVSNPFQPVPSCSNLLKGSAPPGGRGYFPFKTFSEKKGFFFMSLNLDQTISALPARAGVVESGGTRSSPPLFTTQNSSPLKPSPGFSNLLKHPLPPRGVFSNQYEPS